MSKLFEELYKKYEDEFKIYEGLTFSSPLNKVVRILHDHKIDIMPNYKDNDFSVIFTSKDLYYLEDLEKFLHMITNMGWYPHMYALDNDEFIFYKKEYEHEEAVKRFMNHISSTSFSMLIIYCDAHYSIPAAIINNKLYHVTKSVNVDKILRIGLCPRNKMKKTYHPKRVYFCLKNGYYDDMAEHLYKLDTYKDLEYTVLEIDTSFIKFYLRVFKDSHYPENGVWTYNNIHPKYIHINRQIIF
jgi:hypothetical protein